MLLLQVSSITLTDLSELNNTFKTDCATQMAKYQEVRCKDLGQSVPSQKITMMLT